MAYIINKPAASETIGLGLGQGLGSAINQMLDQKMRSIQSHHIKNALENLKVPQQDAESIARLYQQSPELAGMFIKSHIDAPGRAAFGRALSGQPEEQQQSQFIQQQPQQMMQQAAPRIPQQTMMALQALQHQDVPQMVQGNPALNQLIATPKQEAWNQALQNYAQEGMLQQQKQKEPQRQVAMAQQQDVSEPSKIQQGQQRINNMRQALQSGLLNQRQSEIISQRLQQEEANQLAHESLEYKKSKDARLETKEIREKINADYDQALKNAPRNLSLINAVDSGNLIDRKKYEFLKSIGFENYFLNPTSSIARSQLDGLSTSAASAFSTSRPNETEIELYRQYLGTLSDTPESIKALAQLRLYEDEANILKRKAMMDVIKQNKNTIPGDLDERIRERIEPQLRQLRDLSIGALSLAMQQQDINKQNEGDVIEEAGMQYIVGPRAKSGNRTLKPIGVELSWLSK